MSETEYIRKAWLLDKIVAMPVTSISNAPDFKAAVLRLVECVDGCHVCGGNSGECYPWGECP